LIRALIGVNEAVVVEVETSIIAGLLVPAAGSADRDLATSGDVVCTSVNEEGHPGAEACAKPESLRKVEIAPSMGPSTGS
jgi:hypothetical protein